MKLEIAKEEDRLTIASLLVKNGYTVRVGKENIGRAKKPTYFVYCAKEGEKADFQEKPATIPSKKRSNDEIDEAMMKLKEFTSDQYALV